MHHNNILERDRIDAMRKKMTNGVPGDDRSPAETWKSYLYISDDTGNLCIPTENLLASMLGGGTKVRIKGKETLKTHSQRIAFDRLDYDLLVNGKPIHSSEINKITGEFIDHSDGARNLGFKLNVKPVTVGTSKHIRVRPLFGNWAFGGHFEIDEEDEQILKLDALRNLFNACGRLVGIGDWRPSSPKKPGLYGRFAATVERA